MHAAPCFALEVKQDEKVTHPGEQSVLRPASPLIRLKNLPKSFILLIYMSRASASLIHLGVSLTIHLSQEDGKLSQ